MFRAQRLREAIPVRSLAWGGLAAGLSLALFLMVVLPFWWNVGVSVVTFGVSYVAAANIANWLGDAASSAAGLIPSRRKTRRSGAAPRGRGWPRSPAGSQR